MFVNCQSLYNVSQIVSVFSLKFQGVLSGNAPLTAVIVCLYVCVLYCSNFLHAVQARIMHVLFIQFCHRHLYLAAGGCNATENGTASYSNLSPFANNTSGYKSDVSLDSMFHFVIFAFWFSHKLVKTAVALCCGEALVRRKPESDVSLTAFCVWIIFVAWCFGAGTTCYSGSPRGSDSRIIWKLACMLTQNSVFGCARQPSDVMWIWNMESPRWSDC